MLSDVNARKMTIKKSVIVIITGLLCLAVLISMLLFFGIDKVSNDITPTI